jgi:hypothetical protein
LTIPGQRYHIQNTAVIRVVGEVSGSNSFEAGTRLTAKEGHYHKLTKLLSHV